ncbi:MAG: hypothetical protein AAFX53_07560 [Bacteroidota bacterium]
MHIPFFTLVFLFFSMGVSSQEISVFSGFWSPKYYQDDTLITKKEAKELLLNFKDSEKYWRKKMLNEGFFYGSYTVSLAGAVWLGIEAGRDSDNTIAPSLTTLGGLIVSAIFLQESSKNGRKAILAYNKQFDKKTAYKLVPIGNKDGFGLAIKF